MPFNVLLDTNIFIACKYNFLGGSLSSLKKYEADGLVHLISNDIINREVKHHIITDVGLCASQVKNSLKRQGDLINAITHEEYRKIETLLLDSPRILCGRFDSFISSAVPLPNDGLSIVELFDDYFKPKAPFESNKEKKAEFPDATVIMSIKKAFQSGDNGILHVVTNDEGWHNALKSVNNIVLHKDLNSLLTQISKEEELFAEVAAFIKENISQIKDSVSDWLMDQDWDFAVDEIDMCIECDVVEETNILKNDVSIIGIDYIDPDNEYAIAALRGKIILELHFCYIDHSDEIYDKEDRTWYNTKYGDGTLKIGFPVILSSTVIIEDGGYELEVPEIEEVEKQFIEIIDYDLSVDNSEYEEPDDRPYYSTCPDCGEKIGFHNDGGNGFCTNCAPNH